MFPQSPKLIGFLFLSFLCANHATGQTTERISLSSSGTQTTDSSYSPSISANGRYIVFSTKSALVPSDTNGLTDVFVRDRALGVVERVSVSSSNVEGDGNSSNPVISADGVWIAFTSYSTNLVPGDLNGFSDVFVHNRISGVTERVNLSTLGVEADSSAIQPSVSEDGQYVAFRSSATNLALGDLNGVDDIFVRDRQIGTTTRASVSSSGWEANGSSTSPQISADGRYLVFSSDASNLVAGDTNGSADIFFHHRLTGVTELLRPRGNMRSATLSADGRFLAYIDGQYTMSSLIYVYDRLTTTNEIISQSSSGSSQLGNHSSPSISADGRYVAFSSSVSTLVPNDLHGYSDIFVRDRQTGVTERVSVSSLGAEADSSSSSPSISADGRYVAFDSNATFLVPGDTNGVKDIFAHDRWNGLGQNSIHLAGPTSSPVGTTLDFEWHATRGSSKYWLAYSLNVNGTVWGGHSFDIGQPATILTSGINPLNGIGNYTSPSIPLNAAGTTVYFEVAARDNGVVWYDSNVLGVTFY